MTDRHAGYVVTLGEDIHKDDAEHIINAIRMVKGVVSVEPVSSDLPLAVATERVRAEMREKLYAVLKGL